jgi:hypothetical protein
MSYTADDCDVQAVMDGLEFDRDGEDVHHVSNDTKEKMEAAKQKTGQDAMIISHKAVVVFNWEEPSIAYIRKRRRMKIHNERLTLEFEFGFDKTTVY